MTRGDCMYLFDLHCDTITRLNSGERLVPGDNKLRHNGAYVALDRMTGQKWCQCFAIFLPDHLRGQAAIDYFEDNYRFFIEQLAENDDVMIQARTAEDIRNALQTGRFAAVLTVEGGSVLAGSLKMVKRLSQCGVRMLTLTWNGENEIASGSDTPKGFTPFGRQAVSALEEAGIILDVSHLNDRGFWELTKIAKRPFIASHSNARTVHNHPRNLTDEEFRYIVLTGGITGINFCNSFLSNDFDPPFTQMAAHIAHFLNLGGEDSIALGSDFDGADVPSWLCGVERMNELYRLLCCEFGQRLAHKICWENAYTFFSRCT